MQSRVLERPGQNTFSFPLPDQTLLSYQPLLFFFFFFSGKGDFQGGKSNESQPWNYLMSHNELRLESFKWDLGAFNCSLGS